MASLPCLSHMANRADFPLRSLSLCADSSPDWHNERRAVRLNVPTVASLRRQSVISTQKTWPADPSNMPLPFAAPSHITSVPSYGLVSGADAIPGNARMKATPLPLSIHPDSTRRGSGNSAAKNESADSSPTTTISTADSLLTGSSPGSSPESPTSALPMHSFVTTKSPSVVETRITTPPPGFDSDSPGRRPRNVRNLSINTRGISTRPATSASIVNPPADAAPAGNVAPLVPAPSQNARLPASMSEPSSPSFIIPQPRKRTSKLGLTISTDAAAPAVPSTPGFASSFMARRQTAHAPETPGFRRFPALREADENMFSPTEAPVGGMTLPPIGGMTLPPIGGMTLPPVGGVTSNPSNFSPQRPALTLSRKPSFEGGAGSSVVHHTVEHTPDLPQHELPLSREVKSPSYPAGPACIYPPNVFLYHQPTAAEAREFDVVINVAREVPNPFVEEAEAQQRAQEAKGYVDTATQCDLLNAPPLQPLPRRDDEPETPKATTPRRKEPEYIHLPWEHNSHVYESWLETCELIDARAKAGKKVLIHCQLGVSRSASLIVAYGLYLNPSLSPDEAREQAKGQSKWIDLNMHFMYELGDFKKILHQKFPEAATRAPVAVAPPLCRTRTEVPLSTTTSDFDESRRASTADEPSSAPPDANWSPTEPSLHEESFDEKPAKELEAEDSSDVPTPVRAEASSPIESFDPPTMDKQPELPKIAETTVELPSPADPSLPPPPMRNPARDMSQLVEPKPQLRSLEETLASFASPASSQESVPMLTPPRRLRPMPSLPAGFHSLRKVSPPGLTLNTQPEQPKPLKPVAAAPELPPLDFGSSLMSPRTSEFVANPFKRNSLAGDLAGLDELLSPGGVEDPRSPPHKGEHAITRNIADVL